MLTRTHKKYFREGTWSTRVEIEAFVQEVGEADPVDIAELLEALIDRKLSLQPQHEARCLAIKSLIAKQPYRELFEPMVKTMVAGDATVRRTLMELIPLANNVDGHGILCLALGNGDADVRAAAKKLLGQLGGVHALNALVKLSANANFAGRLEAIEVMVPKARHHAVPLLKTILDVGEPHERVAAIRAVTREFFEKDLDGAVRFLLPYLNDAHERVVAEAAKGLAALVDERAFFKHAGHLESSENARVVQGFIEAVSSYKSTRVLNYLAKIIRQGTQNQVVAAIESLEKLGTEDAVAPLIEALSAPRVAVRGRAAEALANMAQRGQVDLARIVIWLLKNRDVNVRRMASELARQIAGSAEQLTPRLLQFLRDEDWWVRERVLDALVEMSGTKLTAHIAAYLQDPSDVIRRYAIGGLRRIKDPQSIGVLVKVAMEDTDWWTREEAIGAVGDLGDPRAIPYLIKMLFQDSNIRLSAIRALETLKAKDAIPMVAEAMGDKDSNVRAAAIHFLGTLGDRTYANAINQARRDDVREVRKAAEDVLIQWNANSGDVSMEVSLTALEKLLVEMAELEADDLLLTAGRPAAIKKMGAVNPLRPEPLPRDDLANMILSTLNADQKRALSERREIDYSVQVKSHGLRFRVNVFLQNTGIGAVFRIIKSANMQFEQLGLPPLVKSFADFRNGLVLVGGPTGSGKSTTLATLIGHINQNSARHIVTIEDPIETVHDCKKSLINQREVGTDAKDFQSALRSTLRQDPDVILVGEMRDHETIGFALAAAETGHLVFGTVHTVSSDTTIDRMLNVFPPGQRPQIRSMLSETLRAVLCQHLLRHKEDPKKRVLALELMMNDSNIASLIRKDKCYQIPSALMISRDKGMQTMDMHLSLLVTRGTVGYEEAFVKANDKAQFTQLVESHGKTGPQPGAQAVAAGAVAPGVTPGRPNVQGR